MAHFDEAANLTGISFGAPAAFREPAVHFRFAWFSCMRNLDYCYQQCRRSRALRERPFCHWQHARPLVAALTIRPKIHRARRAAYGSCSPGQLYPHSSSSVAAHRTTKIEGKAKKCFCSLLERLGYRFGKLWLTERRAAQSLSNAKRLDFRSSEPIKAHISEIE